MTPSDVANSEAAEAAGVRTNVTNVIAIVPETQVETRMVFAMPPESIADDMNSGQGGAPYYKSLLGTPSLSLDRQTSPEL